MRDRLAPRDNSTRSLRFYIRANQPNRVCPPRLGRLAGILLDSGSFYFRCPFKRFRRLSPPLRLLPVLLLRLFRGFCLLLVQLMEHLA